MLKNYLKIAWRQLIKNRRFTILNLIGLSTGLACTLLIYGWIQDERAFDHFHENDPHLFQVMENKTHEKGIVTTGETPALLAETLASTMPEVQYAAASTPASWFPKVIVSAGEQRSKTGGIFAGKDYLRVFSYPLLQGNAQQVLQDKNGIVISEKLAQVLFHDAASAVGKTVTWQFDAVKKSSIVTGILKNTPANSSTQFDFILPFDAFKDIMHISGMEPQGPFLTYLVLKNGTNVTAFNAKLSSFMTSITKVAASNRNMFLQRYSDNYLYGTYENGVVVGGRISYVKLFSLIALFIILIAAINFVNLSTAKASGRMKEMGIRKALGATVTNVVMMLSKEFFRAVAIAVIIGLPLAWYCMDRWLQGFAYHIRLGVGVFIGVGGAMLLITLLTVSIQSIRAALENPVKSLRME